LAKSNQVVPLFILKSIWTHSVAILFLDFQLLGNFQDALKNILLIFAKLNPGIRYVQGMNEVLAPLFYVFKNDPDEENAVSTSLQT